MTDTGVKFKELNEKIAELIKIYFQKDKFLEKHTAHFKFELESDGKGNIAFGSILGQSFFPEHINLEMLYHTYNNSNPYLCSAEKQKLKG